MYKISKLVSGKYRGATDTPIVNKQGSLLTTEAEQEARWAEQFSEVLNRPPSITEAEVQDPDTDLDVSASSPTERKNKLWQLSDPSKTEKARDRTASAQKSSR